jgi:hypothetical protein
MENTIIKEWEKQDAEVKKECIRGAYEKMTAKEKAVVTKMTKTFEQNIRYKRAFEHPDTKASVGIGAEACHEIFACLGIWLEQNKVSL